MGQELFNRIVEVDISGPRVSFSATNQILKSGFGQVLSWESSNFEIEFDITRSLDDDPNNATITFYNLLSSDAFILSTLEAGTEATAQHNITISAGYMGQDMEDPDPRTSTIFRGRVNRITTNLEDSTYITTIEATDGYIEKMLKPVNGKTQREPKFKRRSYGNNIRAEKIVEDLMKELRISGSIDLVEQRKQVYKKGRVIQGHAYEELKALLSSLDLEFSIQGGEAQILEIGGNNGIGQPVDYDSGLIGNTIERDNGVVEFSTLMLPNIYPGTLVEFNTKPNDDPIMRIRRSRTPDERTQAKQEANRRIDSIHTWEDLDRYDRSRSARQFRVERANYKGNSRRGDFSILVEATSLKQGP